MKLAVRLALALALTGCAHEWRPTTAPAPTSTHVASSSIFERPWVWLDDHGQRVAFAQWRGTPFVLAAIYTTCQETCPRTLAQMRQVYDQFEREHRHAEFVIVTIDPETDTPDRLREFRASRHLPDSWHLWTGGSTETQQLVDLLGIHLMDMDTHVVHDSKIVLFDGNGVGTDEYDIL